MKYCFNCCQPTSQLSFVRVPTLHLICPVCCEAVRLGDLDLIVLFGPEIERQYEKEQAVKHVLNE